MRGGLQASAGRACKNPFQSSFIIGDSELSIEVGFKEISKQWSYAMQCNPVGSDYSN
jgi:hypothetical protein